MVIEPLMSRANFAPYKVGKKRKIAVPAAPPPKRFAWVAKFVWPTQKLNMCP